MRSRYKCWRCGAAPDVHHPIATVAGNQGILDDMREYLAALKGCRQCGAGPWPTVDERARTKPTSEGQP